MDIITRIGEYTLSVWETSKAHAQGFYKWEVARTHDELPEYPETLKSSGYRYMTVDQAMRECVDAFYDEAGAHRFTCMTCKDGTVHQTISVDLNSDSTAMIVWLQCNRCKTKRTMDYPCKIIGGES